MTARRALVEANAGPSMRRQCELLGVNRSSLYYEPVEPDAEELGLMRRIDELHLKRPFLALVKNLVSVPPPARRGSFGLESGLEQSVERIEGGGDIGGDSAPPSGFE